MLGEDAGEEPGKGTAVPAAPTLRALLLLPQNVWGRAGLTHSSCWHLAPVSCGTDGQNLPFPGPSPVLVPFPSRRTGHSLRTAQPRGASGRVGLGLKHHPINSNVPSIPHSQGNFNRLAGDNLPGQNAVKGDKITHLSITEQGTHSLCSVTAELRGWGSWEGHGAGRSGFVGP